MTSPDHAALRSMLYDSLREQPHPLLVGERFIIPAASLWTGARAWVKAFRTAGLWPGDRIVLSLPRGPAWIMANTAAWCEGLTVCPTGRASREALETYDARAIVCDSPLPHAFCPTSAGDPLTKPQRLRCSGPSTPDIALIMTTSGSVVDPKRIALSHGNVVHQLRTHGSAMGVHRHDRVWSALPWFHAFGLLVDLWPALLAGATVFVDSKEGRDAQATLEALDDLGITRACMVPMHAQAIAQLPGGQPALRRLSGVIGGAPVREALARTLRGSNLRIGYGQTEASPGICLGQPGEFIDGGLGRPVGCDIAIRDGELSVRGHNVCAGIWRDGTLTRLDPDRWLATGDLVEQDVHRNHSPLRFLGRMDDRFKLSNGRMVDVPSIERALSASTPDSEAVVFTPDGIALVVAWLGEPPRDAHSRACSAFGSLSRRLRGMVTHKNAASMRTPKGAPDRRAIAADYARRRNATQAAA
ncbi:MAG: AMP-binding protein [Planctomycetota bacterium]